MIDFHEWCFWCGGLISNGACQDCNYQPSLTTLHHPKHREDPQT